MIGPPVPDCIRKKRIERGVYKLRSSTGATATNENTIDSVKDNTVFVATDPHPQSSESSSEDEFGAPIPGEFDADAAEQEALERLYARGSTSVKDDNRPDHGARSDWLNTALGLKEAPKERPKMLKDFAGSLDQQQNKSSRDTSTKEDGDEKEHTTAKQPVNPKVAQLLGTGIHNRFAKAGS